MKEEDLAWIEAKIAAGDYTDIKEVTLLVAEVRRLRSLLVGNKEQIRLAEQNRCVLHVSEAADRARESNRKKAAAELDLIARDIADYREVG
jgi:GTP-dependent phosphoenolpyruvate carboxykinase